MLSLYNLCLAIRFKRNKQIKLIREEKNNLQKSKSPLVIHSQEGFFFLSCDYPIRNDD